jgi:hypothetical protein
MNNSSFGLWLLLPLVLIVFVSSTPNIFGVGPYNQSSFTHQVGAAQFGPHRYIAYQNLTTNNYVDILFKESHDNGTTFSNPINLNNFTNETSLIDFNANPQVGAFGEDVYVIWHGKLSGGNVDLFYIKSSDGGRTFENATNVSETNDENKNVNVIHSILLVDRLTGSVFVTYTNDDGSVVPCHVHCDG